MLSRSVGEKSMLLEDSQRRVIAQEDISAIMNIKTYAPLPERVFMAECRKEEEEPPNLVDNPDSLHVFTVVVGHPSQIRPALKLLEEALERSPGQEVPLSPDYPHKNCALKRYVALDAEFKHVKLKPEYLKTELSYAAVGDHERIRNGRKEKLVSVLTLAVDRQLVFSFYLLDMLQNPSTETVKEVCTYFL